MLIVTIGACRKSYEHSFKQLFWRVPFLSVASLRPESVVIAGEAHSVHNAAPGPAPGGRARDQCVLGLVENNNGAAFRQRSPMAVRDPVVVVVTNPGIHRSRTRFPGPGPGTA